MTAAVVRTTDLTREEAEEITYKIQTRLQEIWDLVGQAWKGRAWIALGHASWDTYCQEEFGSDRIKIPLEEREEVISRLRREEMSTRAIAAATGLSKGTVGRVPAAGAPDGAPATETVTGLDGKTYPARPAVPVRREAVGCFDCGATITGPVFYNDDRPYCNDCDTLINPDPVVMGTIDPDDSIREGDVCLDTDGAVREDMQAFVERIAPVAALVTETGVAFVGREPVATDAEKALMRAVLMEAQTAIVGILRSLDL